MKVKLKKITAFILAMNLIMPPVFGEGQNTNKAYESSTKAQTTSNKGEDVSLAVELVTLGISTMCLAVPFVFCAFYSGSNSGKITDFNSDGSFVKITDFNSALPNRGIANAGNSCYINAMMQQLYSIDTFRNWILNFNRANVDKDTEDKINAMRYIFCCMGGALKCDRKLLNVALFKLGYEKTQEDTFDLIEKNNKIFDLFNREYFGKIDLESDYMYATVPVNRIGDKGSVLDAINNNYNNGYIFCPVDGQFMIIIRRAGANNVKIETPITMNPELSIPTSDSKYKLTGFIVHHRNTARSGHYVSYKYSEAQKKWYKYNDYKVTEVSVDEIFSDYVRKNVVELSYTDVNKTLMVK